MIDEERLRQKEQIRDLAEAAVRLRNLPYSEYLKSDHWKETRLTILDRDGERCVICNSKDRLEVHHRTYERLGEELPDDLCTLCHDCHDTFHVHRQLARPQD